MELASDTRSFTHPCFDGRVEFSLQLPDAQLIRRPQQRQEGCPAEGAKPIRLVIRRRDGEIQLCRGIVPQAVTVGCDSAKRILPGRQVRIEGLAACTGVVPVMVIAVQLVAKFHLLWNQKCWRGVINLQVPGVRRELEVSGCCEFLSVDNDGFDICLCRDRFQREPGRIHHL